MSKKMREKPTIRIPIGIFGLLFGLGLYALAIAWASQYFENWPMPVQAIIYLVLGLIWLPPLRPLLIWMETGSWRAPKA